jgi:hypothetical protein
MGEKGERRGGHMGWFYVGCWGEEKGSKGWFDRGILLVKWEWAGVDWALGIGFGFLVLVWILDLVLIRKRVRLVISVTRTNFVIFPKMRTELVVFPNCFQGPKMPIINKPRTNFAFFQFSKFPGTYFAIFEISGAEHVILENL